MERGRETMEVRNLCDRAGTEELGPGAGRNGENPWDLLAAHAGSVWENLRVNRHSLVTCSSCCLWENALSSPGQLCCVGVLWWLGNNLCAVCSCAVCCVLSHGGDEALLSMKSHSYFGRRLCWSATYKQLFEPAL